jgi:hypothetical protein
VYCRPTEVGPTIIINPSTTLHLTHETSPNSNWLQHSACYGGAALQPLSTRHAHETNVHGQLPSFNHPTPQVVFSWCRGGQGP